MLWVLFFVGIVELQQPAVLRPVGIYKTMDDCFTAREMLIEKLGRPVISYQAVCVAHDATEETI